jgi:hypothetical protein
VHPIKLTSHQWKTLIRIGRCAHEFSKTSKIMFRSCDVVVTDGRRIAKIPLAPDPERNVAIEVGDILLWLKGIGRYQRDLDFVEDGGVPERLPYTVILEPHADGDLRLCISERGAGLADGPPSRLFVKAYGPDTRVPDHDLDAVLELADGGAVPNLFNPRYFRDLERLWRYFRRTSDGARMRRSPLPGAFAFTFESSVDGHVGEARYVVMALRESAPTPSQP